MAETAQANRVRHFELCFVEFAHSVEKLEPCKSDSFFFAAYGITSAMTHRVPTRGRSQGGTGSSTIGQAEIGPIRQ